MLGLKMLKTNYKYLEKKIKFTVSQDINLFIAVEEN